MRKILVGIFVFLIAAFYGCKTTSGEFPLKAGTYSSEDNLLVLIEDNTGNYSVISKIVLTLTEISKDEYERPSGVSPGVDNMIEDFYLKPSARKYYMISLILIINNQEVPVTLNWDEVSIVKRKYIYSYHSDNYNGAASLVVKDSAISLQIARNHIQLTHNSNQVEG